MASIFDAYAQAYDKALTQEARLAENLRLANIQRQNQAIAQAQEGRQAQRFGIELPVLQANASNDVIKANITNMFLSDPAFQKALTEGKISGAQFNALINSESLKAAQNLGPNLSLALGAGYEQNANAAIDAQRKRALMGNDPQEVSRLFGVKNPRQEGGFWLDDSGNRIYSNPVAGAQANMWENLAKTMQGEKKTAETQTPMQSMTSFSSPSWMGIGSNRSSDFSPMPGTVPPVTPVPAVTPAPAARTFNAPTGVTGSWGRPVEPSVDWMDLYSRSLYPQ